jgi:hypothetical protein
MRHRDIHELRSTDIDHVRYFRELLESIRQVSLNNLLVTERIKTAVQSGRSYR